MLGLFRPKPPLDTGEKMWVEGRMRWLAGKLGLRRLLDSEMILPEPRYFPDTYRGTHDDTRRIFDRVCGYMGLEPGRFDLDIRPDAAMPDAAGRYRRGDRPRIELAESQLADPERLVATIAHELAHDILLGGGLLAWDEPDHEEVTDLLPVFLGLGVFAANSPVRHQNYTEQNRHYFRIDKQGYLPSRMIGYALALFAYARGEDRVAWAHYLRPDAAHPFKGGLRYLRKTGDSLFRPDTADRPVIPPTEAEAIDRLATGSATVRARTLCDIAGLDPLPAALAGPVARRLRDGDTDVQIEAARILPLFGAAARDALPDLVGCLGSDSVDLRGNVAAALPRIGAPAEQIVPELARLLDDPDEWVVDTAATWLESYGRASASALPALVGALRRREVDCLPAESLVAAIHAIDPSEDALGALLQPIEQEIRIRIRQTLRAARPREVD